MELLDASAYLPSHSFSFDVKVALLLRPNLGDMFVRRPSDGTGVSGVGIALFQRGQRIRDDPP